MTLTIIITASEYSVDIDCLIIIVCRVAVVPIIYTESLTLMTTMKPTHTRGVSQA